jgi:hypothetical protein
MLFGVGLAGLAVIVAAGFVYLQQTSQKYQAQATIIEASLRDQKQGEVQKQAQDISNSLKLAVQVLSKQVVFSQLLKQLAVVTPSNASLSGINISQIEGAVDITAKTTDYNAATQLQINLADPANKIFAKADIVSISCVTPVDANQARYPCTVVVRSLFAENNPYLFINDKAAN